MKLKLLSISMVLGVVAVPVLALAAEFKAADQQDGNLTLSSTQTHKNLYAAGGNVSINSPTAGDLVVAGGMVSLDGSVEDDLMAAGGTLFVNGTVGGNARVAGGNITITSAIAGDLLIGGGNVTLSEKASVGGDLVVAGGNVSLNAPIRGSVRVTGGNITVNSRVERELKATASQRLSFGPNAEVAGGVSYRSPQEASIDQAARLGSVEFNRLEQRKFSQNFKALLTVGFLIKILAWIIAGLLLMRFRKERVHRLVESVQRNPWRNLGYGLVSFILVPIVIILVFVTVVGYYVGIIAALWYLLVLALANLATALVAGALVLRWLNRPGESAPAWQVVVIGVVVLSLVKLIPVVGWIIAGVLCLMVLGAFMDQAKESVSTPAPPEI